MAASSQTRKVCPFINDCFLFHPPPENPYRNTRVMNRRGGEPREAPRTRLFITLPTAPDLGCIRHKQIME